MRKSFGARGRVPRKVGQDDDDESGAASSGGENAQAPEPVVKRPAAKTKKRSSLRLSFGPAESGADSEGDGGAVFTPKKSNLSRIATERNAERKGFRASLSADQIPRRDTTDDERPSYSKDYLNELRNSTPSTPKEEYQKGLGKDEETMIKDLDIASKFGPLASLSASTSSSAIPTDAEIREKKERRARLAQQQQYRNPDFMSLDADEDEEPAAAASDGYDSDDLDRPRDVALHGSGIKEKYAETRLVPDDEDIAEGFDEFVSDGRIALGRAAEREAARRRRAEMASMIADAEGGGASGDGTPGAGAGSADDDSEAERNAAYEAAQTRAGTYAARDRKADEAGLARPRTPPRIAPLPELGGVVARLRGAVRAAEEARAAKARRVEELVQERKDIVAQEDWIQKELREAGERYERLRAEAGAAGGAGTPVEGVGNGNGNGSASASEGGATPRELDSLGASPAVGGLGSEGDGEVEGEGVRDYDDEDEDMADARPGLGARAGLGA